MSAPEVEPQAGRDRAVEPGARGGNLPQLRTLLLTDLVDSVELVARLGDGAAAELFRAHDRLVLQLQQRWRGRLIDRSDGMLLLFERPIDGLGFALDYMRGLQSVGAPHDVPLKARAGLHVGEVLSWRNSDEAVSAGAKAIEVEGLAKPLAARLMGIARPGQVLLSAVAEPLAHRAARELGERGLHLVWKSHGRWRFKGVPEPQQVFEVGEPGLAPLQMPRSGPKAWRDLPLWRRPAALAAQAAVVVALVISLWMIGRPQPAIAFNERDWVVMGDLRNLTGESLLDESLEQAFRISLEQSRHVNVLGDLKVRGTLERMQLDPETVLDRDIASEIALRDGARAVILPTVAEVGGKLRVTAEVVDPASQATVGVAHADGERLEDVLASVDRVAALLREDLGEALKAVADNPTPLPRVTAGNLEALRAYALGMNAYVRRDSGEALEYFNTAIELDPGFSLAYLAAARVYASNAHWEDARRHFAVADRHRERLTARDRLYLDAWRAELDARRAVRAPSRWKLLSAMYPDFHAGNYQYAWMRFEANEWDEARRYAAVVAEAQQEPLRNVGVELVARIDLATGHHEEALEGFRRAAQMGGYAPTRRVVNALAALGRYEEANRAMEATAGKGLAGGELISRLDAVSLLVDQGRLEEALDSAGRARQAASDALPLAAHQFRLVEAQLQLLASDGEVPPQVLGRIAGESLALARDDDYAARPQQLHFALAAAYLAQRQGDGELAAGMLEEAPELVAYLGDPMVGQMLTVLRAGQRRLQGAPEEAIALLEPLATDSALFQVRVALRDAYQAAGRHAEALELSGALASLRGLAYIEAAGDQVLQPLNVADTRLARLAAAEALSALGDRSRASSELDAFLAAWPEAQLTASVLRRVEAIRSASKANTTV